MVFLHGHPEVGSYFGKRLGFWGHVAWLRVFASQVSPADVAARVTNKDTIRIEDGDNPEFEQRFCESVRLKVIDNLLSNHTPICVHWSSPSNDQYILSVADLDLGVALIICN